MTRAGLQFFLVPVAVGRTIAVLSVLTYLLGLGTEVTQGHGFHTQRRPCAAPSCTSMGSRVRPTATGTKKKCNPEVKNLAKILVLVSLIRRDIPKPELELYRATTTVWGVPPLRHAERAV